MERPNAAGGTMLSGGSCSNARPRWVAYLGAAGRWHDVDLASGWLHVHGTKTYSADRRVKVRGALRDELLSIRARDDVDPDAFVFPTTTGRRMGPDNFRTRVPAPALKRASETLADANPPPLPRLTPQSLRRTFASVLYALGESPPLVMAEMGHTDPGPALRLYTQAMRLDDSERGKLGSLVDGGFRRSEGDKGPFGEREQVGSAVG